MRADEVLIAALKAADLPALGAIRCSHGEPFEDVVERQIRDALPLRYLASPSRFDGRMLLGTDPDGQILVVGAHHVEPTLVPDVGYTVQLPQGREVSLGELMLYAIFKQMLALGRHPRTFVRIDRRNAQTWRCATESVCRTSVRISTLTWFSAGANCHGADDESRVSVTRGYRASGMRNEGAGGRHLTTRSPRIQDGTSSRRRGRPDGRAVCIGVRR